MPDLRSTVGDERAYMMWFEANRKQKLTGKVDDPDSDSSYDWRGAYKGGAKPDASGTWPPQYKRVK